MTKLINPVVVEFYILAVLYSQSVSVAVMHVHIRDSDIFTVKKMDKIIISISSLFFGIPIVISIDLKATYSDILISSTTHLSNQRPFMRPICVVFKLYHGCGIPKKGRVASDENFV
ncbi:hypothetical protein SDC9_125119 [bioreactor metagenome]|uniref:Uncharacterized protein n=1 Tax=bioreactor metagenome TaxID=1076179 RepID=A0A645CMG9_9ZZZZ